MCSESTSFWCRSGSECPFWCRSESGSGISSKRCRSTRGSYPTFTNVGTSEFFYFFSQHCQYQSLISVKCVIIFSILDNKLKFSRKNFFFKVKLISIIIFAWNLYQSGSSWSGFGKILRIRPDPDPQRWKMYVFSFETSCQKTDNVKNKRICWLTDSLVRWMPNFEEI